MKQFPKIQINNPEDVNSRTINSLQDQIVDAVNPLLSLPLSSSNFLENINLITGDNIINHGLNRVLRGWFVTRQNASATFFDKQDSNPLSQKTLILNSSANVKVSLEVF